MSGFVAKALRGGIGGEKKRGISTFLFTHPGRIRAFATDLDNLRRHGPSRRATAGRTATMAGTPAISRTAAPIHRASVSRAGGPLDAEDPAGIATTPRDASRGGEARTGSATPPGRCGRLRGGPGPARAGEPSPARVMRAQRNAVHTTSRRMSPTRRNPPALDSREPASHNAT